MALFYSGGHCDDLIYDVHIFGNEVDHDGLSAKIKMSKAKIKDIRSGELSDELEKIIKKMKRVQKAISSSKQPPGMHEVDALTKLGKRYAVIVNRLKKKEKPLQ